LRRALSYGGGGPGPVPGDLCSLPQAALDSIKKAILAPPSPTEIAKAITIPIDDIAKKAVELQKAPLDAIEGAIKKEVDEKVEGIKEWAWEKIRPILYAAAILTALFVALIISVPIL
jgi:hypothetical protein